MFKTLLSKGKIIDVGCGAGRDALLFAQDLAYEYIGIDVSEAMLKEAQLLVPHVSFREMSMYALEFPPQTFDGFWAAASLLHIPKKNIDLVLQEIRRILKPGGIGFIAVKEGVGEGMVEHGQKGVERFFAYYTADELTEILKRNSYELVTLYREVREGFPPPQTTVWLVSFVRLRF